MYGQDRDRLARVAFATAIFLVVSLNSPPSLPSVPQDRAAPPTPEEIYVLEGVAEWVLGHPISEGFRAFRSPDLASAVRSRPQSFELFRRYSEDSARRSLVRQLPFGELVHQAAERHRTDALLLVSIMEAESGYNPRAISPRGALGLMQIMPSTANLDPVEDLLDPSVNIDIGSRYFASLMREFDGDVTLALAGYNAGPASVRRFGGMPPYRETRDYVDRVLSRYVGLQRSLWQISGARDWLF